MTACSSNSTLGVLLDNPDAKAVLLKYIPDVVNSPQINQGRGMTLASVAQVIPALMSEMIAKIDADLAPIA